MDAVLEFKCPCCNAPLIFGSDTQQMKCDYCDNVFALETLLAFQDSDKPDIPPQIQWDIEEKTQWDSVELGKLCAYLCDACGGELVTDEHTAATFCPYCGNPAILPGRISGNLKPEAVIPFKTSKEDAQKAFLNLCRGKPLLPRFFTEKQQLEKITGLYVPFWLYDCQADLSGSYKATRIHTWADSRYFYTKTDHYLLRRQASATYSGIPMDGSSKMDDTFMESIEPYDYSEAKPFEMAYLSGFLADKYDVAPSSGEERIKERVTNTMNDRLQSSFMGYATVLPASRQMNIRHSKAKYVLLPVWMLNTKYNGKTFTFAMNGQTGKITGTFPICKKRSLAWFVGIWAASAAVISLIQLIL